jgi:hypothetical protein
MAIPSQATLNERSQCRFPELCKSLGHDQNKSGVGTDSSLQQLSARTAGRVDRPHSAKQSSRVGRQKELRYIIVAGMRVGVGSRICQVLPRRSRSKKLCSNEVRGNDGHSPPPRDSLHMIPIRGDYISGVQFGKYQSQCLSFGVGHQVSIQNSYVVNNRSISFQQSIFVQFHST